MASRSPLLGWTPAHLQIEGVQLPDWLLRTNEQSEVGEAAYDAGARILRGFFTGVLEAYDQPDLDPLGHRILTCFRDGGAIRDFEALV